MSTRRPSSSSRIIGLLPTHWLASMALGAGLVACSSDGAAPSGGAAGAAGVGGATGAAGVPTSAGTGGTNGTSGSGTGGAMTVGTSGAGGMATTGGASAGGGGGMAGAGGGAAAGTGGGGAPGGGGSSSESCKKGTTKGNEVLFIGESFVDASAIPAETSKLARAAGSLAANDSYVEKAVSGTWIGNGASNSIPNQYKDNSSGVRFVLMNGGGNDCWQGGMESHRTAALNAAEKLFQDMGAKGVEKVVYFFYPDPIGSMYASLKSCLDVLRPAMKAVCDKQTAPKCYWLDLREAWNGHPEYTKDGIHVDEPGNAPTAKAIFEVMTENCVAP